MGVLLLLSFLEPWLLHLQAEAAIFCRKGAQNVGGQSGAHCRWLN